MGEHRSVDGRISLCGVCGGCWRGWDISGVGVVAPGWVVSWIEGLRWERRQDGGQGKIGCQVERLD